MDRVNLKVEMIDIKSSFNGPLLRVEQLEKENGKLREESKDGAAVVSGKIQGSNSESTPRTTRTTTRRKSITISACKS